MSGKAVDPLLIDFYAGDQVPPGKLVGEPDIAKIVTTGAPWHGVILKATEGSWYPTPGDNGRYGDGWFLKYWPLAKTLAGDRYGRDWFRGAYHYMNLTSDPVRSAYNYLGLIDRAGGWAFGDLWPFIDVESGDNPAKPGAAKIEDHVSTWAAIVTKETGRKPVLYGNIYLAENGVTSQMGCQMLWVARYTAALPQDVYQRIGWSVNELFAWQYVGTEPQPVVLSGYPAESPVGKADISVVTISGGGPTATLDWIRSHLYAEAP